MSFSIMTKILKSGTRYTVSKRGNNTVIQKFWSDGTLAETKVKNIVKQKIGNKEVITKNEFLHEATPYYCTGAKRRTTDRVYDSDGHLLGIRKIIKSDADSCEMNLAKKIEDMKNALSLYMEPLSLSKDSLLNTNQNFIFFPLTRALRHL